MKLDIKQPVVRLGEVRPLLDRKAFSIARRTWNKPIGSFEFEAFHWQVACDWVEKALTHKLRQHGLTHRTTSSSVRFEPAGTVYEGEDAESAAKWHQDVQSFEDKALGRSAKLWLGLWSNVTPTQVRVHGEEIEVQPNELIVIRNDIAVHRRPANKHLYDRCFVRLWDVKEIENGDEAR